MQEICAHNGERHCIRAAGRQGALSAALRDLSHRLNNCFLVDAFMNDLGLHILGCIGGRGLDCAFGMMQILFF